MANKEVRRTRLFKKAYKKLEEEIQGQVDRAIAELASGELSNSRRPKLRKPKKRGIWQIYINNRGYRLTYMNDGEVITLSHVGTHDEIERRDC